MSINGNKLIIFIQLFYTCFLAVLIIETFSFPLESASHTFRFDFGTKYNRVIRILWDFVIILPLSTHVILLFNNKKERNKQQVQKTLLAIYFVAIIPDMYT